MRHVILIVDLKLTQLIPYRLRLPARQIIRNFIAALIDYSSAKNPKDLPPLKIIQGRTIRISFDLYYHDT